MPNTKGTQEQQYRQDQADAFLTAVEMTHQDIQGVGRVTGVAALGTEQGFMDLARINLLLDGDVDLQGLEGLPFGNGQWKNATKKALKDANGLVSSEAEDGRACGEKMARLADLVKKQKLENMRVASMGGIGLAFNLVKTIGGILETALETRKHILKGNGAKADAFSASCSQEQMDGLEAKRQGCQALQALMERAMDTTLPVDERIIAKRSLELLNQQLDGDVLRDNLKDLVGVVEDEVRQQVTKDADFLVEEQIESYLEGRVGFAEIRNENQLFRSLPKLSGKTTIAKTLTTYDPKALYALGHTAKTITPELLEAGVVAFDAQFGHLEQDHQNKAYRATGFESPTSTLFIDGKSVKDYAKEHGIPCDGVDMEKAIVMGALASGEHHVELGTLGMDEKGNFAVNVSTVKMDLTALDGQEGLFTRKPSGKAERLYSGDSKQAQRQEAIKGTLQSAFASGMNREMNRRDLERRQAQPEENTGKTPEKISVKDLPVKQNHHDKQIITPVEKTAPVAQQGLLSIKKTNK